jgi:multisubunit Na+/H+ antiporter MnhB subunit
MSPQKINRITVGLLVLGLGSALVIFLTAHSPLDPLLDDPLYNKKYLYEMRRIGGEANVLSAELRDWFAAQWQGKVLARTVAVLTVATTVAFRFITMPLPPDPGETDLPSTEPGPPKT